MIKDFNDKDLGRVMELWLQTNLEAHNFIPKQYWISNYNMVKNILPKSEVYIYEEENVIQGFIGVDNGYVAGLFVLSSQQSKGIGKMLIEKCKSLYNALQLSVYVNNSRGVRFYLREGFVIEKEQADENTKELEYSMIYLGQENQQRLK